eukprot:3227734-Rhodomonas_salina.2
MPGTELRYGGTGTSTELGYGGTSVRVLSSGMVVQGKIGRVQQWAPVAFRLPFHNRGLPAP